MPPIRRARRPAASRSSLLILLAGAFSAQAAPCGPADLNGDGFVDFADYLEFLNLYDVQDPRVDFTGDGLVDFSDYLEFLNLYEAGCAPPCAMSAELAAVPLVSYPFADFVQACNGGSTVSIAVDPFRFPALTGKTTRIYITANQAWTAGMPLVDVRAGGFQTITWPGGSVTASTFALDGSSTLPFDAGEDIGVAYDLVIDENANGVFDGCDVVDGAGAEGGFSMIRDLTTANAATAVTQIAVVKLPADRVVPGIDDQRWHFPADIASRERLPLITISMGAGAHYSWFDFLAQHLASYGYIVVSGETNDAPGVVACSTSTLDHTNSLIALQATLGGGVLDGHIDQSEIYFIGFSRAAEGVVLARDRLARGLYAPTGGHPLVISVEDIKYIQAIAPTDFLGAGVSVGGGTAFSDPGPLDFMLLYGSADGDICGCPGSPITWAFDLLERADARRSSVYIHGADHNDFNCCGFEDFTGPAGTAIGRAEAQKLQKAYTLASIKHYRAGNIPCGEVLWRQYEGFRPGATLATATVDLEFKDSGPGRKFVIDDYQTEPAAGTSSSGGAVTFDVGNLTEGQLRDNNTTYAWLAADPFNGMSRARTGDPTRGVVFDYSIGGGGSASYTLDIVPAGRDTTPYSYLSFRAAQGTQHPYTQAFLGDQDFEVELEDSAGRASRIRISAYGGGVEEVYQRLSGTIPGWQNEFETIKLRLAGFTADGRTLDLTDIAKVRFLFGGAHGTPQGRLALDDIEFVK
ncbi:MAG: hypothetical protein IT436_00440 [Phycisphaerales bacterium]|nr:hypothetical protein [Phycisphaerales bacterium]